VLRMATSLRSPLPEAGANSKSAGIWGACDRGDVETVRDLIEQGVDVNARNCLGCVPLMYAAGSGHAEVTKLLLAQPAICVNIRNNDRLTTFMLAMQVGRDASGWTNSGGSGSGQEQLRKMMDLPALGEMDWARNDKWTALMEAASFGQLGVVSLLLAVPGIELDAVNIRGQTAAEVAANRSHPSIAEVIKDAVQARENPVEVQQIKELEEQVEVLKVETRRKLIENIDSRYGALGKLKDRHESEMEPLTREIDVLQTSLEEAMKKRLKMITRQVNEVKNLEDEIQITKRQLDSFDRLYGMGGLDSPMLPPNNIFEKDFECPVCYDVMVPPSRIFQCNNGHLICEDCKCHSEIRSCPTCRVPLGPNSLLRNIPMEKLAKTYFERCAKRSDSPQAKLAMSLTLPLGTGLDRSNHSSRRSSTSRRTVSNGTPSWPHDDMDSRIFDW